MNMGIGWSPMYMTLINVLAVKEKQLLKQRISQWIKIINAITLSVCGIDNWLKEHCLLWQYILENPGCFACNCTSIKISRCHIKQLSTQGQCLYSHHGSIHAVNLLWYSIKHWEREMTVWQVYFHGFHSNSSWISWRKM